MGASADRGSCLQPRWDPKACSDWPVYLAGTEWARYWGCPSNHPFTFLLASHRARYSSLSCWDSLLPAVVRTATKLHKQTKRRHLPSPRKASGASNHSIQLEGQLLLLAVGKRANWHQCWPVSQILQAEEHRSQEVLHFTDASLHPAGRAGLVEV